MSKPKQFKPRIKNIPDLSEIIADYKDWSEEEKNKLELDSYDITPEIINGIFNFLESPNGSKITSLLFDNCIVSSDTCATLAERLQSSNRLLVLNFHNSTLGDLGKAHIIKSLAQNESITCLGFSGTNLNNKMAKYLAETFETNSRLKVLYADKNKIGNNGAIALADILEKRPFKISLVGNKIGDEGIAALNKAFATNINKKGLLRIEKQKAPDVTELNDSNEEEVGEYNENDLITDNISKNPPGNLEHLLKYPDATLSPSDSIKKIENSTNLKSAPILEPTTIPQVDTDCCLPFISRNKGKIFPKK